ncbi:hypothetical protein L839_5663 [Mycobacterium avium MAV_120809_2495]|nr:hypothetical protein L839_5663 [Mycobacterium avium MAV_120809_2495]
MRLAHVLGEFVDRHLAVRQRPEHLHASGIGQHPEDLDDQTYLSSGSRPALLSACIRKY